MLRARVLLATLAMALLVSTSGCLTIFSKTEVIRGEEPRRPIRFESLEAAEVFNKATKDKSANLGGTHLGIPFITLYSKDRQLSDSAHFNDCVLRCDTDQDGTITLVEAKMFASLKD